MTRIENATIVLTADDVNDAIEDFLRKYGVQESFLPTGVRFELSVHGNGCIAIVTLKDDHTDLR